ncbi:hypothetical protein [Pseudemcibacter aquimaris]|uniref:hypothetical protein n=1 Tax=Pseudemcibacter aquimaris TaxID=2857064 RepID=UPI0020122D81|nr:hypothetical protein [Pseudemcibacter aquimaris]MCC3862023.1 hypothetical protein [Pseudemcibacter aquimaris]WDU58775.1 hypothetical protein KW060_00620 [Pseudemcibacter aquimaris]
MQSNIIIQQPLPKSANANLKESAGILLEMEMMGIDPTPFLEIAARDLANQYGAIALDYSLQIESDFKDEGNMEAAAIWNAITAQLNNLEKTGNLIAH